MTTEDKMRHAASLVQALYNLERTADAIAAGQDIFEIRNEAQRERERAKIGPLLQATAQFPDDGPIWVGHPDPTPIDWRALWTKAVGR